MLAFLSVEQSTCSNSGEIVHSAYFNIGQYRERSSAYSVELPRLPPTKLLNERHQYGGDRSSEADEGHPLQDASTKELMARMGHASPRATLIYQHATHDRDRDRALADAMSRLANATRAAKRPTL